MPLTCFPAPVCHLVSEGALLFSQVPKILLWSKCQVLVQCIRMVTVALGWPSCPQWSDNSWPVIFSSRCIQLGYIAILKRFLWCSVSSHQTDHHHFHLLLFTVLQRLFLLRPYQAQIFHSKAPQPSTPVTCQAPPRLTPSAFALNCLPSSHSSLNPSFTFFSAACWLLSAPSKVFFVLCFISQYIMLQL